MNPLLTPARSKFRTEMAVRPDDIDMNRHVHASHYFDYVLAARYDQMARFYQMPMEEFLELGYGWVVRKANLDFKRSLKLGDLFTVTTWIEEFFPDGVHVRFEIHRQPTVKLCCDGSFHYTMVSLATGRAQPIPDWIQAKYAV
jgi:YbgC/YbaW family acyl-CoA thioester hydrolase